MSDSIAGTIKVGWSIDERGLGVDHIQRELTKGELAALYDRIADLVGQAFHQRVTIWIDGEDECYERMQAAEKQVKAIAMLVSIYERQRENEPEEGWPEGDLHPSQVLQAIGETIGQPCSICRSRHGSEVRHHAE